MLKSCKYELWGLSVTDKPLNFTPFVISMSLSWGLNASKASARVSLSPDAKRQLMNVRRGSQFVLSWGFDANNFNKVYLYWTGTTWEVNAGVQIDLVHKSWELSRTPVRGSFNNVASSEVAKKLTSEKGVKLKASALGNISAVIAVNQTIEEELLRQFKGEVIKHGFDGKSMEVVSFDKLKETAQAYYISTEQGFISGPVITYKAVVPKDRSYTEVVGGGSSTAEPNANPSPVGGQSFANSVPLEPGTYALLLSTNLVNDQKNPILELKLVVNGQQISSYQCVSGTAYARDSSKTNNVLPDGEYLIASGLVPGATAEVGGKFLAITPKFKTSRSALGIHLDPSYNKKNGEDGTSGCIGLITAEDRDAVHKSLLENNIRRLVVRLKDKPEPAAPTPKTEANSAYFIGDLNSNKITKSNNENAVFSNIASLFKLYIAYGILKNNVPFTKIPAGQSQTVRQLLTAMLGPSENPPANVLITELGGAKSLTSFCKTNGYVNSEIDGLYSVAPSNKSSTAKDIFEVFKDIFMSSDSRYVEVQQMLSESLFVGSLNIAGQTHTKSGNNSKFDGAVALVPKAGTKYIVVVFAKTEKEKLEIAKEITQLLV
jgi:hypothetical protein